jgi:hypothetical protein
MTVREMAETRVRLIARLEAIAAWNTYGKTIDELTDVQVDKIETQRKLAEVNAAIAAHIDGR